MCACDKEPPAERGVQTRKDFVTRQRTRPTRKTVSLTVQHLLALQWVIWRGPPAVPGLAPPSLAKLFGERICTFGVTTRFLEWPL